jgi:ATP-dependent Clp protease protease subunit
LYLSIVIITINGEITRQTAEDVKNQLKTDEPIELRIDSTGGDLFAGLNIYNMLQGRDVSVFIDGVAGSVASIIALSGKDKPQMASTSSFAIHNAHADNIKGNQHDVQKVANSLAKYSEIVANVYVAKTGLKIEEVQSLMDSESVFNSDEAIDKGFAGDVYNNIKVFAKIDQIDMTILEKVQNALKPKNELVNEVVETTETTTEDTPTEETGGAFSDEQIEAIKVIVAEVLAESAGMQTEEIGNTIATVLNSIVSEETPPQNAQVQTPSNAGTSNGVTSFYKKMNEIKNKNKAKA